MTVLSDFLSAFRAALRAFVDDLAHSRASREEAEAHYEQADAAR